MQEKKRYEAALPRFRAKVEEARGYRNETEAELMAARERYLAEDSTRTAFLSFPAGKISTTSPRTPSIITMRTFGLSAPSAKATAGASIANAASNLLEVFLEIILLFL